MSIISNICSLRETDRAAWVREIVAEFAADFKELSTASMPRMIETLNGGTETWTDDEEAVAFWALPMVRALAEQTGWNSITEMDCHVTNIGTREPR